MLGRWRTVLERGIGGLYGGLPLCVQGSCRGGGVGVPGDQIEKITRLGMLSELDTIVALFL